MSPAAKGLHRIYASNTVKAVLGGHTYKGLNKHRQPTKLMRRLLYSEQSATFLPEKVAISFKSVVNKNRSLSLNENVTVNYDVLSRSTDMLFFSYTRSASGYTKAVFQSIFPRFFVVNAEFVYEEMY